MRVPVAPHPCQHLKGSVFSILAIPVGVQWCLTMVSMYIVKYPFYAPVCLLYVFFDEMPVQMFCLFFIGFVLLWNFENFSYFPDKNCEIFFLILSLR